MVQQCLNLHQQPCLVSASQRPACCRPATSGCRSLTPNLRSYTKRIFQNRRFTTMTSSMGKELGPIKFGRYHKSFDNLAQIIFIRHGEKISDDYPNLSEQGYYRADNLNRVFGWGNTPPGAFNTPDVIYAQKKGKKDSSSIRPYETVKPLAEKLLEWDKHHDLEMGERTVSHGRVFDNRFRRKKHKELKEDLVDRAKDEYEGKTIMICWEHKNIPYIVARFGLTNQKLEWGLDPLSGADDRTNFSAIWVFTPSRNTFQVFRQFELEPPEGPVNDLNGIQLSVPEGGYGKVVFSQDLDPNMEGDHHEADDDKDGDEEDDDEEEEE